MALNPAQELLFEYLHPDRTDQILLLEGGDGSLASRIADRVPDGVVRCLTRDARDVWSAQTKLVTYSNAGTGYEVIPDQGGWDTILLPLPKERRYARSLLVASHKLLKPGGRLLLAGPTRKGAKAVTSDAGKLFGNATVLGYRSHQRIAVCRKDESTLRSLPVEFQQNGIAPGTIHRLIVATPHGSLDLETHPGIFSWEAIDEGTEFLLAYLEIEPGDRVWDVGCGYGVIGLGAVLAGAASVVMTDINLLAVDYAKRNALRNQIATNVWTFPADGMESPPFYPPETQVPGFSSYDLIVSNPAFHQGHQVNKSMPDSLIALSPHILAPGGRLLLVANRFLNYDRQLQNYFSSVHRIAANNKYHILEASNQSS